LLDALFGGGGARFEKLQFGLLQIERGFERVRRLLVSVSLGLGGLKLFF